MDFRVLKAYSRTLAPSEILHCAQPRKLTFWQYISDHGQVIAGPQLDQSKTDFANAFVFTSRYPASMTAAEFVDALNANTSSSLTQSERDALVNGLSNGTEARGSVVRKIAENQAFIDHEYNASFVLAEYFDYLRRDPTRAGMISGSIN